MAKTASKASIVDVWKKKRWHRILAPKIFNEQVLGETPSFEPNALVGRTVSVNLMNLTRDMKKQNMNLIFEIDRVLGDTAFTKVKYFEISPSSIRRLVRKGKVRVDDSFLCKTADNMTARVKILFVASNGLKGAVSTILRKKAKEFLVSTISATKSDLLVQDVVSHKLQKDLKDAISKTYPVRICEIRMLEFVEEGEKVEGAEAAAQPVELTEIKVEEPAKEKEEEPKKEQAEEQKKPKKEKKENKEKKEDKEEESEKEGKEEE